MTASSLDDLMRRVLEALLKRRTLIKATRGECREINGAMLRLTRPRARLSRSEGRGRPFSALGELLWYLAGSKDLRFISYYVPAYRKDSEDGKTIHGAYGPRLLNYRGQNQVANVIELLRKKPTSRRAVIQLFDARDLAKTFKEIPCTCTLQFILRGRQLHMVTNMRSNDAFLGLPHDVFAFTMLQEVIARSVGVEPGVYHHAVGNLHLYREHEAKAQSYIDEGWQYTIPMPPMPTGDPWAAIKKLLRAESRIRRNQPVAVTDLNLPNYWSDLARLLQAFGVSTRAKKAARTSSKLPHSGLSIEAIRAQMTSPIYDNYLLRRQEAVPQRATTETLDLFAPRPAS